MRVQKRPSPHTNTEVIPHLGGCWIFVPLEYCQQARMVSMGMKRVIRCAIVHCGEAQEVSMLVQKRPSPHTNTEVAYLTWAGVRFLCHWSATNKLE
jgi:hypothetical protein